MNFSKLYYIASNHPTKAHSELVDAACSAGVKLIQLRMKGISQGQMLSEAITCKEICEYFDAKLIINDELEIARQIKADGIHLGQNDTSIKTARAVLGSQITIGGTANTYQQVSTLLEEKVDYIGLGPYKHTQTKKHLSPILGLEGYQKIFNKLGINIPVYAIGGIKLEDVDKLMQTGIYGVAVASSLTKNFSLVDNFNRKLNLNE